MFTNITADLRHYARYCYRGKSIWKIFPHLLLAHPAVVGIIWYRLGRMAWKCNIPAWKQVLQFLYILGLPCARIYSGVQIHPNADVAPGLAILHSGGVVIAPGTRIGPDSLLHHNVNLIMYRDAHGPSIGAHFYAGAGVIVIDNVTIEDDVTAGAGSIITKSIPRNAVVAGAPARFIRFRKPHEQPSENKTLAKRPVKEWISTKETTTYPEGTPSKNQPPIS
jgi:serine acetyltransferase